MGNIKFTEGSKVHSRPHSFSLLLFCLQLERKLNAIYNKEEEERIRKEEAAKEDGWSCISGRDSGWCAERSWNSVVECPREMLFSWDNFSSLLPPVFNRHIWFHELSLAANAQQIESLPPQRRFLVFRSIFGSNYGPEANVHFKETAPRFVHLEFLTDNIWIESQL